MKLSLEIIKNMNQKERFLNKKSIRKFLLKASPTKLRIILPILNKKEDEPFNTRIKVPLKIKTRLRGNPNKNIIYVIKKEPLFVNYNNFLTRQCRTCGEYKEKCEFNHNTSQCKECKNNENKNVVILEGDGQICLQCLDFKPWDYYLNIKKGMNYKGTICRDCRSNNVLLKFHTDINFKLSHLLRKRALEVLKGEAKSIHTLELLGCSIEFFKEYFKSLFTYGMTWDNHGNGWGDKGMKEWYIDHIYPCASFDLSNPEEQKICFHWSNLQPLWAKDNLIKNNKI